ncbi:MAG: hypothetical protein ABI614_12325 [Planctomycetota bacterium]
MIRGFVRGKTIELNDDPGLPEGQEVAVTVRPVIGDPQALKAGAGLKRAFGGWADDAAELDEFLEWNRRQRKVSRADSQP